MTKQDLIEAMSQKLGGDFTKNEVARAANCMLEVMAEAIVAGEDLAIRGFGAFTTRERSARVGRNLATGETLQVPAMKVVRFAPAKALKDAVNA